MSDINNQICDAISIIVDKRLSQANFDKTIQATIIAQGDKTKGEYKVKYLDSSFYAYDKSGKDYTVGTQVYVLVPENDLSKVKTILGTADKTKDIQPIVPEGNKFEYLTNNLFIIESSNTEFGIKSWENRNKENKTYPPIYIYNRDEENADFKIDTDGLSYIEKEGFGYFILKCNVRTNLQKSQQSKGNYGIRVTLTADLKENQQNTELESPNSTDNIVTDQKIKNINLDFVLDSTMMVGNPYSLVIPTAQIAGFNVSNYKNITITSISLFSENFDALTLEEKEELKEEEKENNNIFFTDLSLQCANKISADNLNGNYLYISVPEGQYISNDGKESITLKAIFQSKGQIIDPAKYSGLTYYWFKKNPLITVESNEYCKINGINTAGWECINPKNTETNTFKAGGDIYTITKNSFLSNQQEYRCIALFDNLAYSKTKMVYNKNPQYAISLTSDNGTIFYNNNGQPNLECRCREFTTNSERAISANYDWYSTNIDDQRKFLKSEINKQISKQSISINQYPDKVIIDCAVVKYDDKTFIGVGTLELLNLKSDILMPYTLTIDNGSQMFKYNTLGISPIHASRTNSTVEPSQKEKEAYLQPFSFTLLNNKTGEVFKEGTSQKWVLPPDNETMFDFSGLKDLQDYNKEGYKVYKGTSLSFTIKSKYDYTKINNTILLEVVKENQTYIARTNTLFVKEGDNGTNGTDYVCQIVGMANNDKGFSFSDNIPFFVNGILKYDDTQISTTLNPNIGYAEGLSLIVYKNGELISNDDISNPSIQWSILKQPFIEKVDNKNNIIIERNSEPYFIEINESNDKLLFNPQNINLDIQKITSVCVLKAELSFKETESAQPQTIYASLPIGIIQHENFANSIQQHTLSLKNNTGFFYAIYSADGVDPQYEHRNFKLKSDIFDEDGKSTEYNVDWSVIGTQLDCKAVKIKKDNTTIQIDDEIAITPKASYNTNEFNNAVCCRVHDAVGEAIIIIPIHLYLNRFGHAAINGWDGNTVSIDNEGGIVLAPQIGAGFKNKNNAFTGVLMGTSLLKDHDNSTTNKDVYLKETGLMGLHNGERSFFLKSEEGSAIFGKNGSGQIKIMPEAEDGKPQAVITGGLYPKDSSGNPSGMEINLSAPSITYGNKKFSVDKNGILTCTDANINGWFSATQTLRDGANYQHYELIFTNKKSNILMQSGTIKGTQKKFEEILLKPGFFRVGSSTGQVPVIENKEQQEIYDLLVQNGIIFSQENNIIITNIDELISSSSEENIDNLVNIKNRFFSNDSPENLKQDVLTLFYQVQERDNNIESIYDDDIDNIEDQEDSTYLKYSQGKVSLKGNFYNTFYAQGTQSGIITEKKGKVSFSANNGILMSYSENPKSPVDYSQNADALAKFKGTLFELSQKGFKFCNYKIPISGSANILLDPANSTEIDGVVNDKITLNNNSQTVTIDQGIIYSPIGGLNIVGRITATSGMIGGWKITDTCISSKEGNLVLYSDGRIIGSFGENSYYENSADKISKDIVSNSSLRMEGTRSSCELTNGGIKTVASLGKNMSNNSRYYRRTWTYYSKDLMDMWPAEYRNGAIGEWIWDSGDPFKIKADRDNSELKEYSEPILIKRVRHPIGNRPHPQDSTIDYTYTEIYECKKIVSKTDFSYIGAKQKKKNEKDNQFTQNEQELDSVVVESMVENIPILFSLSKGTEKGKVVSNTMKLAAKGLTELLNNKKNKKEEEEEKPATYATAEKKEEKTSTESKYAELSLPYEDNSNGNEVREGTRINPLCIITGDVKIDEYAKTQMKTRNADSLVSAVNEMLTPPDQVTYEDGEVSEGGTAIDTIIETWEAKDGIPKFEFKYKVHIENKGKANESVKYLIREDKTEGEGEDKKVVLPGYTIKLTGF